MEQQNKIALAMIVKGDDEEAKALNRFLKKTRKYVDDAFITITQKNDKVEEVCKKHNCKISHFEWCDDFSKARNYNFSQVGNEYEYIMWADADDEIEGVDKIKELIKNNPDVDVFCFWYLYDFDEWGNPTVVHQKSRIVRNDGCVEWVGALHEDFIEKRKITIKFVEDIKWKHLKDEKRINNSKERNYRISRKMLEENPDEPRNYWNLGNSLYAVGKYNEAIEVLINFLERSSSLEEKYIANLRIAECFKILGLLKQALFYSRGAIGLKPEYPDAYHLTGEIYLDLGDFKNAKRNFEMGIDVLRRYGIPKYSIIVFNPRDYDLRPLMGLARVYLATNMFNLAVEALRQCLKIVPKDKRIKELVKKMEKKEKQVDKIIEEFKKLEGEKDKEKIKKKIKEIPKDLQSHPFVCYLRNTYFIKKTSSGRDIVFVCDYTEKEWDYKIAMEKGVGGSEEAVINLSREFVKRGYNVTVYNNCGNKTKEYNGVIYKPYWSWNFRDKQDITILWRYPRYANYEINSEKVFVDLHDVIPEAEFTEKRLKKIDKIFVKSDFHRRLFPSIEDEKFVIIPNGIDISLFDIEVERDKYLLVNTSSPDRSLSALIEIFKKVQEKIPEVKLKWAYGWDIFDISHIGNQEAIAWKNLMINEIKKLKNFEILGRINHREVAKLYKKGNIFIYPTEFAEIDCISARKAQLAGCYPITTDFAALDTTIKFGDKIKSSKTKDNWCKAYQFDFAVKDEKMIDIFVDKIVEKIKNPVKDREEMMKWGEEFSWEKIADKWIKHFNL